MSDLISRQTALDALGEAPEVWTDSPEEFAALNQWEYDVAAIKAVPSADRPIGHWIYKRMRGIKTCKCSECLTSYGCMDTPYRPNCGTDMRGGNDEIR